MLTALLVAGLLNADAVAAAADGQRPGATRTTIAWVGARLQGLAAPLHLDAPRTAVDRWLDGDADTGTSLLAGAGELDAAEDGVDSEGLLAALAQLVDPGPGRARAVAPARPVARPARAAGAIDPPLRVPQRGRPTRLLVTGDSLTGWLGPQVARTFARTGVVNAEFQTFNGTGLTRPKLADWSQLAVKQARERKPEVVVVFLGGNDDIGMPTPSGRIVREGTPAWQSEYQRRVEVVSGAYLRAGVRRVYWVSLPPARDARRTRHYALINAATRAAAARVAGLLYLDILPTVAPGGRYVEVLPVGGRRVEVRDRDGVHLNRTGSALAADAIGRVLRREWRLP